MQNGSVPPSFAPKKCSRLNKAELSRVGVEGSDRSYAAADSYKQGPTRMESTSEMAASEKIKASLQRRPWLLLDQTNHTSMQPGHQQPPMKPRLSKVVTTACPESGNCSKVTERRCSEGATIKQLENAPVFYPTDEEFKDTVKYIASVRAKAAQHGICRISPPPSWIPPNFNEENNIWKSSRFAPHIQRIDGLRSKLDTSDERIRKKRRISTVGLDCGSEFTSINNEAGHSAVNCFEAEPCPEYTLDSFKRYADDFKHQYFRKSDIIGYQEQSEPSVENIEAEYTRIVENPTEGIEVLCGNNLETTGIGSGFPIVSSECLQSGWNLNNLPRLPGSLLSFESTDTCQILVPQTRAGMCFSSTLWRVEEHHLYSLCYNHLGAPKVWYGVPGSARIRFEKNKRKSFPDISTQQGLNKQVSPSALKSENTPVFRCIQHPGEFVIVFPGAYHSAFDCGFNFSESACFAPLDWLPLGQYAVELYSERGRKTSISYDKLLLGAARAAVRSQWENFILNNTSKNLRWKSAFLNNGILIEVLKTRLKSEEVRRSYCCTNLNSQRMSSDFDATTKRECCICFCDLHFSAVGCPCAVDKYSCLFHAKQRCFCDWSNKFVLYRHDIMELDLLVEALKGKLSAIIKWAKDDLGLNLHEHQHKRNAQSPEQVDIPIYLPDETRLKEYTSEDTSSPVSTCVTASSIRAELKARMLKSPISKMLKANSGPMASSNTATIATSSIRAESNARILRSLISRTLKNNDCPPEAVAANDNGINSIFSVEVVTKEHKLQSTISDEHTKGLCTPRSPGATLGAPLLPIEVASDVSSVTSSESSSESDDIIPDLREFSEASDQAESRKPQDCIHAPNDDSAG